MMSSMRIIACILIACIALARSSEAKSSPRRSSRAGKYQALIRQFTGDISLLVSGLINAKMHLCPCDPRVTKGDSPFPLVSAQRDRLFDLSRQKLRGKSLWKDVKKFSGSAYEALIGMIEPIIIPSGPDAKI